MRDCEAGFTLIEALVAMAVLAAGAVTLLTATERQAALAGSLQDRVVARWVATDQLTLARIGLLSEGNTARQAGLDWTIDTQRNPTEDPSLDRIDISVAKQQADAPLYTLTGFVRAQAVR